MSGLRHRRGARACAVTLAALLAHGAAARAAVDDAGNGPIEIEADAGIEWRQQERLVLARGNARALRGTLAVRADVLGARYRERADGSTEVWRLEADGAVEITRPDERLEGDHATYDFDSTVLVMTGKAVRMTSREAEIRAERSIEYAAATRTLTARGNAAAREGERLVRAETLVVTLRPGGAAGGRLARIDAADNVVVVTRDDVLRGDRGTYDLDAQRATLSGAVKITRGDSQLDGCRAELDLASGVGQLFPCPGATDERARVRGLIVPERAGRP